MPFLKLYAHLTQSDIEVPMAQVIDYDIPESGQVTDGRGNVWTISSEGDLDRVRVTTFVTPHDMSITIAKEMAYELIDSLQLCEDLDEWYPQYSSMNYFLNMDHDGTPAFGLDHYQQNYARGSYSMYLEPRALVTYTQGLQQNSYGAFLAIQYTGGSYDYKYYYGMFCITIIGDVTRIAIIRGQNINDTNFAELEFDPGDKGFIPVGARTRKRIPGIGGKPQGSGGNSKNPEYKSDPIAQPGEPDESIASITRSGILVAYDITDANLKKVSEALWSSTFEGAIASLRVNPMDFIVSLNILPYTPHIGSSEAIQFGRWRCDNQGQSGSLGIVANGAKLTQQYRTVDFGTLSLPENWGNFLDYERTSIDLYLPFIGTVSIDPSEVLGGTINVQYTIDFYTGQCVANVLCTKSMELPSGQALSNINAQHSYQGNCATQIPLSRVDYGAMVGNLINSCTQAITNPGGAVINIAEGALNGAYRPNVTSKGNIVANSGYCSVLYPYVRITRPITAEPESYQEIVGYPSYINTKLGDCSGLCIVEDIDLTGITGATESELSRLKQMCQEGVYI